MTQECREQDRMLTKDKSEHYKMFSKDNDTSASSGLIIKYSN